MATGKHRAIDQLRRNGVLERKLAQLGRELETEAASCAPDPGATVEDHIGVPPDLKQPRDSNEGHLHPRGLWAKATLTHTDPEPPARGTRRRSRPRD
jgi:hypothetical protein